MKYKLIILCISIFVCSFSFAQIKFEDLKIDTSITRFHLAGYTLNTEIFRSANGSFSFNILHTDDYKEMKNEFEKAITISRQDSINITDVVEKDTTLNGYKAFYMYYKNMGKRGDTYKDISFFAFVIKDHLIILFQGHADDDEAFIEKFKKTFFRIKI